MMVQFATFREAVQAGWVPARKRLIERRAGGEIRVVDTSGPNAYGYSYDIVAFDRDGRLVGRFGESEDVWLSNERNQLGICGAVAVMFAPDVYRTAIEAARQALEAQSPAGSPPADR